MLTQGSKPSAYKHHSIPLLSNLDIDKPKRPLEAIDLEKHLKATRNN